MENDTQNDIGKFLEQSLRFYENIDQYSAHLGIDAAELEVFKNDIRLFLFITGRYKSFTESFVRCNFDSMHRRLDRLADSCKSSKNYNNHIGEKLGIATPQRRYAWPMISWQEPGAKTGFVFH